VANGIASNSALTTARGASISSHLDLTYARDDPAASLLATAPMAVKLGDAFAEPYV